MATQATVVVGTLPTTGTLDLTSSGFGTVQAAILIGSMASNTSNPSTGNPTYTIGFWDGVNSNQVCIRQILTDAAATTATSRVIYNDRVLSFFNTRYITCSATTDGITLTVNGTLDYDFYVTAIFINGVTNVKAANLSIGNTVSAQDVTSVGFKADLLFAIASGSTVANGVLTQGQISFGAAHNNSSDVVSQGLMLVGSATSKASGDPYMQPVDGRIAGQIINASIDYDVTVSDFDTNGFTITTSSAAANDQIGYLAIELADPDDAWVDFIDAATSTGNSSQTGVGFEPDVVGLVGGLATDPSSVTTRMSFSFGASDGTTQRSIGVRDEDLADPTVSKAEADLSNILAIYDDDGTDLATASLSTMDSDGFTLNYSLAGSAYKILAFAIGDSTAGGGITGTLTKTQASDTISSAGTLAIEGTVTTSQAGDTVSIAGTLAIDGDVSLTQAGDTIAATAALALSGSLSATQAGDTVVSSGVFGTITTGELNATQAGDTIASAGTLALAGDLDLTQAGDTVTAAATLSITGEVSVTQEGDSLTSIGFGAGITGELNVTQEGDTVVAYQTTPGSGLSLGGGLVNDGFRRERQKKQQARLDDDAVIMAVIQEFMKLAA